MRPGGLAFAALLGLVALSASSGAQIGGAQPAPIPNVAGPNDLDRLVAQMDAEEAQLSQEQQAIGPELEVVRKRMIARGRAYYQKARAGLLPVGGGFDALVDHAAAVERLRAALERDVRREGELGRRGAELTRRLERLRAERAPLVVQREAMLRARTALLEAEERKRAFEMAFASSTRPPGYLAVYGGESGPGEGDATLGFKALRGHLPLPLAGRAEVRRSTRAAGSGLLLATTPGTAVRSVAAGRVVFADPYEDYGLTVLVDHGDHYYSLYANLESSDVAVGDVLPSGRRIGAPGPDGQGAALYFELRRGSETLDPGPWLGL